MIKQNPEIYEEFTEDTFRVENYKSKESIMKYSFIIGIKKTILSLVLVGGPILVQLLPKAWMNLTVSGLLTLLFNYLKVKRSQV